jgi:hypothetical protein
MWKQPAGGPAPDQIGAAGRGGRSNEAWLDPAPRQNAGPERPSSRANIRQTNRRVDRDITASVGLETGRIVAVSAP